MCTLFPSFLFAISPWPTCQSLILRPTHNLVTHLIIKYRNCMFMIGILGYFFPRGKMPDYCLTVPRTCNKMFIINKINGWYRTVMFKYGDRITRMIQPIDLPISRSRQNKYLCWLVPINFNRQYIFLKDCYSCYFLYLLLLDGV